MIGPAEQPRRRPRPDRVTGAGHLLAAGNYSLGGLRRLWAETAFRHELGAGAAVAGILTWASASVAEYMVFGGLMLLLVAIEAMNTAVECIVDHLAPGWAEFARDAKDLGSLAVLCVLIAHGLLLAYVLFA